MIRKLSIFAAAFALLNSVELSASPLYLNASYTTPRTLASKRGYATVGAFYCPEVDCCGYNFFGDLRFHRIDNGNWAGNVGGGWTIPMSCDTEIRPNLYWDFENTKYHFYNQIGAGVEWFGPEYDLRLNTYWPIEREGRDRHKVRYNYPGGFFAKKSRKEYTWRGLDMAVGKNFCLCEWQFYLSIGPYYYHSRNRSTTGVGVRAETTLWKWVDIALISTWDHRFGSRTAAQIGVSIPICGSFCEERCCFRPRRQDLILLNRHCHWHTNY